MKTEHKGFKRLVSLIHDLNVLRERREARHHKRPDFKNAEPMTEREFVRKFGDKVKAVRWSGNPDFVGLSVRGDRLGFVVTKNNGVRRVRFIVKEDGSWHITKRYIPVHHNDSISHMWKGLLRNVS